MNAPILAWLHAPGRRFDDAAEAGIELGHLVVRAARGGSGGRIGTGIRLAVHLKFETGLSRNGIAPAEAERCSREAARLERIGRIRVVGLFSHLSNASADDDRAALAAFQQRVRGWRTRSGSAPEIRHLAATAAAHRPPGDAARRGPDRDRAVRAEPVRRPQLGASWACAPR